MGLIALAPFIIQSEICGHIAMTRHWPRSQIVKNRKEKVGGDGVHFIGYKWPSLISSCWNNWMILTKAMLEWIRSICMQSHRQFQKCEANKLRFAVSKTSREIIWDIELDKFNRFCMGISWNNSNVYIFFYECEKPLLNFKALFFIGLKRLL